MRRKLEALVRLAKRVNRELDLEKVAEALLGEMIPEFQLDGCSVYVVGEDGVATLLRGQGVLAGLLPKQLRRGDPYIAARVLETLAPATFESVGANSVAYSGSYRMMQSVGLKGGVAVPLVVSGRAVGVLAGGRAAGPFTPEELEELTNYSEVCAIALANAVAFAREKSLVEALRSNRAQLDAAQELARLGAWEWDVKADRLRWSDTVFRIHGAAPTGGDIDLSNWLEAVYAEDRDAVVEAINRALASPADGRLQLEYRVKRGREELGYLLMAARVTFECGRPVRMVGSTMDITERSLAQDALARSEESLRLIIEQAPVGTAIIGLDGRFVQVNKSLCGLSGYSKEELEARCYQDITHPDDLAQDLRIYHDLLSGRVMRSRSGKRYLRKDGSLVQVLIHRSLVRDADGLPVHFVAQMEDVSEERELHEALSREVRDLRSIIEQAPEGISVRVGDTLVAVNRSLAQTLGYDKPDDLVGATLSDLFHPEDRPEYLERRLKPFDGERNLVTRLRRKDGSWVRTETLARTMKYGNHDAVVAFTRDCSEREKAEAEREQLLAEVNRRRRWLEQVLDRLPVGVVLTEQSREVRMWGNRCATSLFGDRFNEAAGAEQYLGQLCTVAGEPLTAAQLPSQRALAGQLVSGEELSLRRPDGSIITVRVSAETVKDVDGRSVGAVEVFEDVTHLKDLERMREEWMSVIAHDLRQPVFIVLGYAGILRRSTGDEQTLKKLAHIEDAARRLSRMVSDLLDFSRLEARRLEMRREPLALEPVLQAAVERMNTALSGVTVRLRMSEPLPQLHADAARVEQVLENLLTNAYKYGRDGAPIEVSATVEDGQTVVAVTNEGDGLPPDAARHMFGRFKRFGQSTKHGLGLGLYITRGIVEAHGGRIWVDSTPGEKTTFAFTLPTLDNTVRDEPPAAEPARAVAAPAPGGERRAP